MNTKTSVLKRGLVTFLFLVATAMMATGQTFKNGGTLNNASPMSVTNFQNYKAAAGKVINTSTITVNGSTATAFDNNGFATDSVNNNAGGIIDMTNGSGTYKNGIGVTVNNTATSTIKLAGSITNAGSITTTLGTFEYKSTVTPAVLSGVVGNTYGNLIVTGALTKTLDGSITVGTAVTVNTGAILDENGKTLTLNGATPITLNGTGALTASAAGDSTVYNASGAQSVLGTTYYGLIILNGGTKTAGAPVTIASSGTVRNTATFDLGTNTFTTLAAANFTGGGDIRTAGSVSFGATHTIAGTFTYYGSSPQTIGTANYTNLTLSLGGTKTFPATVGVAGSYTVSGGPRNYTTFSNTFSYNSAGAQTVAAEAYNNLTVTNSADTSLTNAKTAAGVLALTGNLTVSSTTTFDMGSNSTSTFPGTNANSGRIRWSGDNVYVAGTGITEMYGATAGNLVAGNYGNLWFTGSSAKTINTGIVNATLGSFALGVTVSNNLTIALGATLHVTSMDLNNDGTVTNDGTITVD